MGTKTLDQHIEITPGVAGDKPRIAQRRITVQNSVIWHEWINRSAEEIADEVDLTLANVYAALAYDHRSEIDQQIQDHEAFVEAPRQQTPSLVLKKLLEQEG